jgi:hypothetical protein
MILLFIILSVIFAIIILVIFVLININTNRKFVIINHIDNCKFPSIIGLTNNGLYTNIINNYKDKILITFISGNEINGTYLNSKTFQLIDKNNVSRIIKNESISNINLFAFNYNLCINYPYRITSLMSKTTYIFDNKYGGFFYNDMGYFAITSVSPLIIKKISNDNFNILDIFCNISWINSYGTIYIKSNPILINGIYWIIGTNKNKIIFILFNLSNKSFINSFSLDINFDIHFGLIFNKFNDTFSIPIIKNNRIQIFNILKNSLYSI